MAKRVFKKGETYMVLDKTSGRMSKATMLEPSQRTGHGDVSMLQIKSNGQRVDLRSQDIHDYHWFDEYKPHVISSVLTFLLSILGAYITVKLNLK